MLTYVPSMCRVYRMCREHNMHKSQFQPWCFADTCEGYGPQRVRDVTNTIPLCEPPSVRNTMAHAVHVFAIWDRTYEVQPMGSTSLRHRITAGP